MHSLKHVFEPRHDCVVLDDSDEPLNPMNAYESVEQFVKWTGHTVQQVDNQWVDDANARSPHTIQLRLWNREDRRINDLDSFWKDIQPKEDK